MERRARSRPTQRVVSLAGLLEAKYGTPRPKRRLPPLDSLIQTILSQNTSDRNSDRAFRSLVETFPDWRAARDADVGEVEKAIRAGGLARQKSVRIQQVLRQVPQVDGEPNLDHLARWSDADVEKYLLSLPGVGRKTASCVLLFSLARDSFPVDTHVLRLTRRLALIAEKTNADRAHSELREIVPADLRYSFHINLIRLGREICRPRAPECDRCPLRQQCPSCGRIP